MNSAPRILLLTLGLALASGLGAAAQEEDEINVCRDENGQIIALQVDPCPELPEPKSAPAPAAAPAPPPAPRPRAPVTRPARPKRAKPAAAKTEWQLVPRMPHRTSATRSRLGKQTFPTRLAGAVRPADPGFTTPERTWRSFLAAAENNDRAAAAACFTPAAINRLGPDPESFPLDDLRRTVATFNRIENEGQAGPFWAIQGVRAGRRPKWILFEKTEAGEWKIAGM